MGKHFDVVADHNPTFEADVKSLADIPELSEPVSSMPVVVTAAFVRNVEGFRDLGSFTHAITTGDPDSFLDYVDPSFYVWELFRSSRDSRPDFTLEICNRTTPVKKWMQRKSEMGAVFDFFDFNLKRLGNDP